MNTTIYTVGGKTFELRHHGVKGMKWGRRKARPQATGTGRRGGQTDNSPEAQAARKEARKQKLKRAAKIGAAVTATALAAYGAKKLHDVVRDKHLELQMKEASRKINNALQMYGPTHDAYRTNVNAWKDKVYTDTMNTAARNARNDSFGTAAKNVAGYYRRELETKANPYIEKARKYKKQIAKTKAIKNSYKRR